MRWRKSFLPLHSTSRTTAPSILSLVLLALCSPVQLDHTESQLLEALCPVMSWSDIQAEYITYPTCWESKETIGSPPPRTTSDEPSAVPESTVLYTTVTEEKVEQSPTLTTSTTTALGTPTETPGEDEPDVDTESPLDNSNFLSFEEWKKQNLANAGQSAENVGGKRSVPAAEKRQRMQTQGISNALDSLGDEAEIELEFGGFGAENEDIRAWEKRERKEGVPVTDSVPIQDDTATQGTEGEVQLEGIPRRGAARRKDAGVTCKERFNYASFDCAATVIKTNPQCTGSSSVLIENKDSYMLNECRAKDKFLILELCDDILVDTVVLANYEFFSSIFRTFRISVSDRYPAKQWREIGTYEAANTREVQAFAVENPLIWARYLKIEFLTHYGNEFYCPLSLVRVHGTTMMEEYKNEGEGMKPDTEEEEAVAGEIPAEQAPPELPAQEGNPTDDAQAEESVAISSDGANPQKQDSSKPGPIGTDETRVCLSKPRSFENLLFDISFCPVVGAPRVTQSGTSTTASEVGPSKPLEKVESATVVSANITMAERVSDPDVAASNSTQLEILPQKSPQDSRAATSTGAGHNGAPTESTRSPTQQQAQPPPPNPTTQESFFKSVHKRLQMLETNSSLSLLYIEEQSRILRDAFAKVEKRQLTKTSNFLENLNNTVLSELRDFRQQYDHVWHSITYQVEQQRQQYNRELRAVSAQLGVLADELVFQKRVSIIQSVFVLICFGIVLFSRSTVGTYLELPRVQSFVARSHFRSRSGSPSYDSPTASRELNQHHHSPAQSHSSYSKSMAQHHRHQRSPSDESHPDDHTSISGPIMTYAGLSPPPSDVGSPRSETGKTVAPEYPHSDISGASMADGASTGLSFEQEEGRELRLRSRMPSPARSRSDTTDERLLSPP